MAAKRTYLFAFIDDVTAEKMNRRINFEVDTAMISEQIQPNSLNLIRQHFTVQINNDLKHTLKATQEVFKA